MYEPCSCRDQIWMTMHRHVSLCLEEQGYFRTIFFRLLSLPCSKQHSVLKTLLFPCNFIFYSWAMCMKISLSRHTSELVAPKMYFSSFSLCLMPSVLQSHFSVPERFLSLLRSDTADNRWRISLCPTVSLLEWSMLGRGLSLFSTPTYTIPVLFQLLP